MAVRLGSVQLRIMRVLWDEQQATARRITEVLDRQTPTAHSTVQTLLRQLEAKQAVGHDRAERTFVYRPLIAESAVSRSAAQDVLTRVFQGSISGLVAHLLDNEPVSGEELSRLRELIDSKSSEEAR